MATLSKPQKTGCEVDTYINSILLPSVSIMFRVMMYHRQKQRLYTHRAHQKKDADIHNTHTCVLGVICKGADLNLLGALWGEGPLPNTPASVRVFTDKMRLRGGKFYDQCYVVTPGPNGGSYTVDKVFSTVDKVGDTNPNNRRLFVMQNFWCGCGMHPETSEATNSSPDAKLLPIFGYNKDWSLLPNPLGLAFQKFYDKKTLATLDARNLHPAIRRAQEFFDRRPDARSYTEESETHRLDAENGFNGKLVRVKGDLVRYVYFTTPQQNKQNKILWPQWEVVATSEGSVTSNQIKLILTGDRVSSRFLWKPQRFCSSCGSRARLRCTRCHESYYCDRTCQKDGWGSHRRTCFEIWSLHRKAHTPWSACICGDMCPK